MLTRFLRGPKLAVAIIVFVGFAGIISLAALVTLATGSDSAPSSPASSDWLQEAEVASRRPSPSSGDIGRYGNRAAQQVVEGGLVEGVTPVALPLPRYHRSVHASRELVTEQRPFQPVLLYLTDWVIMPFVLIWLACLGLLAWAYKKDLIGLYRWFKERMARPPEPPTPAVATAGPGMPLADGAAAPGPGPEPAPEPEHRGEHPLPGSTGGERGRVETDGDPEAEEK